MGFGAKGSKVVVGGVLFKVPFMAKKLQWNYYGLMIFIWVRDRSYENAAMFENYQPRETVKPEVGTCALVERYWWWHDISVFKVNADWHVKKQTWPWFNWCFRMCCFRSGTCSCETMDRILPSRFCNWKGLVGIELWVPEKGYISIIEGHFLELHC